MARPGTGKDFIEALARGLDVIRAFQPGQPAMSLAAVAKATGLTRPTALRILLTLKQMGYVRTVEPLGQMVDVRAVDPKAVDPKAVDPKAVDPKAVDPKAVDPKAMDRRYELTPRVLELGMSYVLSRNLWEVARPHMERLVARTHESSSIGQLDGSDIVYVARVAVPKIVALAVTIGTRFPAMQTSLGKVLLAALSPEEAERVLAEPSRSGIPPRVAFSSEERAGKLREVRARGWALTDEELAAGIRSVAAPLRDGEGRVIASLNVNTHAAETPVEVLTGEYLPLLLQTAGAISADWAACQAAPQVTVPQPAAPEPLAMP
jgi:IclR family pca regulon transcriptional regulator